MRRFLLLILKYILLGPMLWSLGLAQNAEQADTLVVQARTLSKGIALNWYPTQPAFWQAQLAAGYRVTRTEVDSTAKPLGNPVVLAEAVLPRDSAWFNAHSLDLDGLMEPLGALLYDSNFDFPSNELLDPLDMRFNYLAYEATIYPAAAVALGMGIIDTLVSPGKIYQYTVEAVDTLLSGSILLKNVFFNSTQNLFPLSFSFSFPDDRSLSDMYRMVHPRKNPMIRGLARAYGDSIVVRWGPNTPDLWRATRYKGYRLFRSVGASDMEEIGLVRPWPKEEITSAIIPDSMALIATSLLYGNNKVPTNASGYNLVALEKNKFGFALYAAERSQLAASILGLRYVDRDVEPDLVYHYFVLPDSSMPEVEPARILDIRNVFEPLEVPSGFKIEPGDGALRLIWHKSNNRYRFNSYIIERSSDGKAYSSITPEPLVFLENKRLPLKEYFFVDSVFANDQVFYYRLKGYNSFGELSGAAEAQGQAVDRTPPPPVSMEQATFDEKSKRFTVRWTTREIPDDFAHFQVLMSEESDGPYGAVSPELPISQTSFDVDMSGADLDRGFFFKVQSQDQAGNISRSIVAQVAVPDRIAPEPPASITGFVDSLSIVTVAWEHSKSKDVRGYWLYWSNDPKDEMTPVNTKILTTNTYSYYIEAKSLSKKIYYCVRAEDDAFNRGRPSKVIELSRLDLIPPISPIVTEVESRDTLLVVKWEPSASQDAIGQILYRRTYATPDTNWQLLDTLPVGVMQFIDRGLLTDAKYFYRLSAYDEAGNVSDFSNEKSGKLPFSPELVMVNDMVANLVEVEQNRQLELTWDYQAINEQIRETPFYFEVYRATGNEPLRFVGKVNEAIYTDTEISPDVLYQYAVRVRFENGWIGALSDVKSVIMD